jgi:hypothetical protein
MDKQIYKPRIIDQQVEEYLSAFGAVCVEGPKWCGKTWTSSYHSKSEIYIGDPAGNFQTVSWRNCPPLWCWRERRPG